MGRDAGEQTGTRDAFLGERRAVYDASAGAADGSGAYHARLRESYRFLVPPGQRVLEIGCAEGDLLAALEPARGVGVDLSPARIEEAKRRHPGLEFHAISAEEMELAGPFDTIVLSDTVDDLWDIQAVLERCRALSHARTRLIINSYSRLWHLPLSLARRWKFARAVPEEQSWVTVPDLRHFLYLAGFETLRSWGEVLLPLPVPFLGALANRYLVKLWPFRHLALTNFLIARPRPEAAPSAPKVTVLVPARNEAGNIASIIDRTPEMGGGTELIFVEGGSSDETYETIEREKAARSGRAIRLLRQTGRGKGDAVRTGFAQAAGEVLMILDADMTVPPEDLPRFYEALVSGRGEFVNGVRLVYPMERRAMRFCNLVANKFFSLAFSWLLGQDVKDTLCGTKALWREDYERIAAGRNHFGDFDPFGDFDLLFGAAKLNLRIADLPVRYRERIYGTTNIQRWRHGVILLEMVLFAARRIKFV